MSNLDSPTGYDLCCVAAENPNDGEGLERIHQIGLELHQHELRALSQALLRELALRCFNDFRTIFLVHDKRMLGIVLQELNSLVTRRNLFSPVEADILRHAITPTINPGSYGLAALRYFSGQTPLLRKDFLLKPVRGGKGIGILFGGDMSAEEWMSHLEKLQEPQLTPGGAKYVVQLRIRQPRVNVLLPGFRSLQHNYLVGTYMSIHGRFLGLGFWRTSPDRICAISRGGAWICSVIRVE